MAAKEIINGERSRNKWSLQNSTALVTGGTKGIGYAIVEELASLGAIVHTCSRNEIQLNDCLREWERKGFRVTGSVCDVSSRSEREKLMETVSSLFNEKLDILVNNAAILYNKPTVEYTAEDYSIHMSTDFEAPYHLCQLSHPLLKASGSGSIVFLSSVAGFTHYVTGSIYAAAKGAMIQLTRFLACEWAKDNIRSNSVAPGLIRTPLVESLVEDEEYTKAIVSRTPLGRLGEAEDISPMVAFLCMPGAAYITGQNICVDAGVSVNAFSYRSDK